MKLERPYLVQPLDAFSPRIGELVVMMTYTRDVTLWVSRKLTQEQLDARPNGVGNSIGMLLAHIAAVEAWYQAYTFEGKEEPWEGPATVLGELGQQHIKGHELSYYVDELEAVRERTLQALAKRDDAWLYESTPFWEGEPSNNYFKWFHVFEDELNHRGQIRLIRKMLG